jgi:hypothetical protein
MLSGVTIQPFSIYRAIEVRAGHARLTSPDLVDRIARGAILALAAVALASPAIARDTLGIYASWGVFRDPGVPRCYAIAKPDPSVKRHDFDAYADVSTWPRKGIRGAVHFKLARVLAARSRPLLRIGGQRIELTASAASGDAWPLDERGNAEILAAMRSAPFMTLVARDDRGVVFSDTWQLAGAATAMDAATLGCAKLR